MNKKTYLIRKNTLRGEYIRIFGAGYWKKGKLICEGDYKMNEAIYTDAPLDIEKALERSTMLDISIDELVKKNQKERAAVISIHENQLIQKQAVSG